MSTMPNSIYSKHLGTVSYEQLQAALDRFDLGKLIHAEAIPFGFSKRNAFVTSTKGEYILRGNSRYPWQYLTEQFFVRQLSERTRVAVPWPYRIDPSTDIFGWHYALIPCMPGLQLADPQVRNRLSMEERRGIARAMGENLAFLQELTWSCSGRYDIQTGRIRPLELRQEIAWPLPTRDEDIEIIQPAEVTYKERILARIRCFLARASTHNDRTTLADIAWVEEMIAHTQDALDDAFHPCFVMEDYKEQNTVVERINGVWHVTGVFDFTHCHFGDGEADLSRIIAMYLDENPMLARVFMQAYMAHRPVRPGFWERFPLYMLHDRLNIWEFFQKIGHSMPWDPRLTLREWVSAYLSFACMLK